MSDTAPSKADPVVVFPLFRWCPPQQTSQPHPPPERERERTRTRERERGLGLNNILLLSSSSQQQLWYWPCEMPTLLPSLKADFRNLQRFSFEELSETFSWEISAHKRVKWSGEVSRNITDLRESTSWASCQISKITGGACACNAGKFSRHRRLAIPSCITSRGCTCHDACRDR